MGQMRVQWAWWISGCSHSSFNSQFPVAEAKCNILKQLLLAPRHNSNVLGIYIMASKDAQKN